MGPNQQPFRASANANRIDTAAEPRCRGSVISRRETAFDSALSLLHAPLGYSQRQRIIRKGLIYEHDEWSGREVNRFGVRETLRSCSVSALSARALPDVPLRPLSFSYVEA